MIAALRRSPAQAPVRQSYWSLVGWRLSRSPLALVGAIALILMYGVCAVFPEFVAPYPLEHRSSLIEAPPQAIHIWDPQRGWLGPFVYGLERRVDQVLLTRTYVEDTTRLYSIGLLTRGEPYLLLGLIPADVHLFGAHSDDRRASVFLLGTDTLGRDYLSRIIYGGRLSLMVGLIGQILTILLGATLGIVSGYYGGRVDMIIQRTTEFLNAFPDIPLFLALSAAIPNYWSPIAVYFILTIILSLVRWGGLARQVRGLVLTLREREYVLAAKSMGASPWQVMVRHLLPGTLSHVIVIATLAIPGMILSETALSWLGLGLRPPLTSWGVLLQDAATIRSLRTAPWLLWVVPPIVATTLAFNALGDGLRDAMDPYSSR